MKSCCANTTIRSSLAGTLLAGLIFGASCQGRANTFTPSPTSAPITPRSTPTPTVSPTTAPTSAPTPTPPAIIGPEIYPPGVNPLTGLLVDDPMLLARRPLLVKISNAPPEVRPQSGLSYADLVFENYAEGGWTRFAALFYSQDITRVGSVRSLRLVDLQLATAYDAILVFSGGSRGVIDTVRLSPLYPYNTISPQFGYGEPYFARFPRSGLAFEHTLFTNTIALRQWLDEKNVREEPEFSTPGMSFRLSPPTGGTPAAAARLNYARTAVLWQYDALAGTYLRWTDGIPHVDALTGEQLAFENVIVLSAYHDEVDLFPEKYFGEEMSLYIELLGEGAVTLLRDGLAFEGRWQRLHDEDMLTLIDQDGATLVLKPGQSFFQIIRSGFEELVVDP